MSTSSLWYPTSAMRRLRTLVRVRWGFVEPFEAVLYEDNPRRWATLTFDRKTGKAQIAWLPPKAQRIWRETFGGEMVEVSDDWLEKRGWTPEPAAWQPIGDWPDPLPEPLTGAPVGELRMSSIGKVEFDATAAAAEMEADRETARRGHHREDREPTAWWRDGTRILYQHRGEVTREMAEGRLMRALACCGHGQDLSHGSMAISQFLAKMAALTLSEALADQERVAEAPVRLEPSRRDHDDFLTAMGWFTRLDAGRGLADAKLWQLSRQQEVLLARALTVPLSFADIGRHISVNRQRAQQIYAASIDKVTKIANARAEVDWPIVELRERNRVARRIA